MRRSIVSLCIYLATSIPSLADQIVLPGRGLERDGTVEISYRFDAPVTGSGVLDVDWSDGFGRIVERRQISFKLSNASEVRFPLDLRRAVAIENELRVRALLDSVGTSGRTNHRESDERLRFSVPPSGNPWRDYQIIMWQEQTARQYATLKSIGVTAGKVYLPSRQDPARLPQPRIDALLGAGMRWYVENIATDFYSAYHRWTPGRPVNWRFQRAKQLYLANPSNAAALVREPSLSDARWLRVIRDRLDKTVRAQDRYRPLFYNLADEAGIADLSTFWDFDFSEPSLRQMRAWLKTRYGTLAALNRQWGSHFAHWSAVTPMTTREAMAVTDDNYSAWADFKEWMDEAFARAIRAGRDAVHAAQPSAYAGIEGGQVPGWGGYDYSRLAHAVDVMELYDSDGNVEILRSLNPDMVLLTTSRADGASDEYSTWRELLRGTRGLILWNPADDFVRRDGSLGKRGRDAASYFREIRSGLGALIINSQRRTDPIAILYSPASMRTQWLLDWRTKGQAWATRDIDASYEDANAARSSMMAYTRTLESIGLHPRFLSPAGMERGELEDGGYRLVILPHAIALSRGEIAAIRRFAKRGGAVVADIQPAVFDEHSRRRAQPALRDLFPNADDAASTSPATGDGESDHLVTPAASCEPSRHSTSCPQFAAELKRIASKHGIEPQITIEGPNGKPVTDVDSYLFRNGGVTIIGLQREIHGANERSDNQDDRRGIAPDEAVVVKLRHPAFVYDLRGNTALGRASRANVTLQSIAPTILAISATPLPRLLVDGPGQVQAGQTAEFHVGYERGESASIGVLHVKVIDPSGRIVPCYSGNMLISGLNASFRIPLAQNDPTGIWTIRMTDLLSGKTSLSKLQVTAS